jgi:hypothetical protein
VTFAYGTSRRRAAVETSIPVEPPKTTVNKPLIKWEGFYNWVNSLNWN